MRAVHFVMERTSIHLWRDFVRYLAEAVAILIT